MSQIPLLKALGTILVICHICAIQAEPFNRLSAAVFTQMMKEQLPKFIQKRGLIPHSEMDRAIGILVRRFKRIARKTEPKDKLSKAEFTELVKGGLPYLFEDGNNPKNIDGVFRNLDENQDGQLSYFEFLFPIDDIVTQYRMD